MSRVFVNTLLEFLPAKGACPCGRKNSEGCFLRILFVTTELFPWVKMGGLADVSDALPRALRARGVDVRLLLPAYPALKKVFPEAQEKPVAMDLPGFGPARLLEARTPSLVPLYLLDAPQWFDRPGGIYDEQGDSARRWGAFCRGAAALAVQGASDGWTPQVVHAHDWQTGFVAANLHFLPPPAPPVVFTIHNLAYQGLYPHGVLPQLGLPESAFSMHGVEFYGQVSFMKAGLYYSRRLTTVSPTYAQEIQTPEHGAGLEGLLSGRADVLTGILNGVDEAHWRPANNSATPVAYDDATLDRKKENQRLLNQEMGLEEDPGAPLFCVISRLVAQKGLDLLLEALPDLMAMGGRLAVLGAGDPALEEGFEKAARRWPGRVAVRLGYDEALAVRLLAGADAILVPSRMEPCGLTQLYGLAFGTLPLVRRTGGLADTVTDATAEALSQDKATGFVFEQSTLQDFRHALNRTVALWRNQPELWRQMQQRAMSQDFGWDTPASHYQEVFDQAVLGGG